MRTMAKIFLQSQRLKFFPLRSAIAMLCVFFNVAAFAESPALTPVTDPKPLLDQMQSEMAKVSSFYLEFVQERRLKLFDEPLKTEGRSEEHTSELQSRENLVCRLLLEKKKKNRIR